MFLCGITASPILIIECCFLLLSLSHLRMNNACKSGWFGLGCAYKCRCFQCNVFGDCTGHDKRCQKYWFGPQCQYRDLVEIADVDKSPGWLTDHDEKSCNENPSLTTVDLVFRDASPFSWLRLVLRDPDHVFEINNTVISFLSRHEEPLPYYNMTISRVDRQAIDIHCSLPDEFSSLVISGEIVKTLCSVHVSMGRSVAIKGHVKTKPDVSNRYGILDGNRGISHSADCLELWGTPTFQPEVTVLLTRAHVIQYFLIFAKDDFSLDGVTIQGFLSNAHVFTAKSAAGITQSWFQYQRVDYSPIDKVNILAFKSYFGFKICHIELYGDNWCPRGLYGMDCERTCKCNKDFSACLVTTGTCLDPCPPGFYGYLCSLKCEKFCFRCHQETGRCVYCPQGFYGESCQQQCRPGRYGYNCGRRCPDECAKGTCDPQTGECHACADGYYKSPCTPACDDTFNCTNRCSERCKNRQCNSHTGACKECYEGYKGPECLTEIRFERELVIMYSMSVVFAGCGLGLLFYVKFNNVSLKRVQPRPHNAKSLVRKDLDFTQENRPISRSSRTGSTLTSSVT